MIHPVLIVAIGSVLISWGSNWKIGLGAFILTIYLLMNIAYFKEK